MIAGVADTHAAIWYLFGDPRLSARAKDFIDLAATNRRTIEISPVSLAEVLYLVEKKNRLPPSAFDDLQSALDNPKHMFKESAVYRRRRESDPVVSRNDVPDMPDRIDAATALSLASPLSAATEKSEARTFRSSGNNEEIFTYNGVTGTVSDATAPDCVSRTHHANGGGFR